MVSDNHRFAIATFQESGILTVLNIFEPLLPQKKDSIRKATVSPDEQYLLTVEVAELYAKPTLHLYTLPGLEFIQLNNLLIEGKL